MADLEELEDFSAPKSDVPPSAQKRHDEKRSRDDGSRSVELEIQESPTSEGDYEGHDPPPPAEGTTPHDPSEWSNVEPEPSLVEDAVKTTACAQPGLPSFAQSEFYTVMFCPITPRRRSRLDSCSLAHLRARAC